MADYIIEASCFDINNVSVSCSCAQGRAHYAAGNRLLCKHGFECLVQIVDPRTEDDYVPDPAIDHGDADEAVGGAVDAAPVAPLVVPEGKKRIEAMDARPVVFGEKRQRKQPFPDRPALEDPPTDDPMYDAWTPTCILDGSRCIARTWAEGTGEQCVNKPLGGLWMCGRHNTFDLPHGRVNEAIPDEKADEFIVWNLRSR